MLEAETASTFVERWNRAQGREDKFFKLAPGTYDGPAEVVEWLTTVGMPSSAVYFSFDDLPTDGLSRVTDLFGQPDDWADADRQRLDRYRLIGVDGGGNPLCLDLHTGGLIQLDHESQFEPYSAYVNSSVSQLAEALLIHAEASAEYQARSEAAATPEEADTIETHLITVTRERLTVLDPTVMKFDGFWNRLLDDVYPFV